MERILPVVRAEAFPVAKRPDRLRSLNSLGMVAGSIADVTWLAIGILRHQLLPMVRVDALVPEGKCVHSLLQRR
jgi:hypothetical protein